MRTFILLLLCISFAGPAQTLRGEASYIADGDTLTLQTRDGQRHKIRLAEIDAPERSQPYGEQATRHLQALVAGEQLRVQVVDTDRYGRLVGRVFAGDLDINRELVLHGGAWVYRDYLTDQSLLAVEQSARNHGRGLWALAEQQRIPPWDWRADRRADQESWLIFELPGDFNLPIPLLLVVLLIMIYMLLGMLRLVKWLKSGIKTIDRRRKGR